MSPLDILFPYLCWIAVLKDIMDKSLHKAELSWFRQQTPDFIHTSESTQNFLYVLGDVIREG